MPIPHIEEIREILDPGQINLRLHRTLERRPRRFQRRPQFFTDQELGLLADLAAGPGWDIPEEISRLYQPIDAAVAQIFAGAIRYRGPAGTMTYRYPLGAG